MASLKKNFFYSIFLTTSSYLMSLAVFPSVSRVLGPASLGLVSLTDGAVGCFTLLATMGINSLGIREIAKYRNDREKLSDIYSNLFSLSLIFMVIGVAGFIITGLLVPNLRQYPGLIIFGALSIAAQVCVIEWFYKGMEDFRYITIRGVIVKLCYIIAVFLLIKNPEDYLIYFALIVATYAINAIINIIYSHRFVRFRLKGLKLRAWLKPFFFLGSYTILGALYYIRSTFPRNCHQRHGGRILCCISKGIHYHFRCFHRSYLCTDAAHECHDSQQEARRVHI